MHQSRLIDSNLSRTDIPLMPGQNLHDSSQDQSPETIAHYRILKRLGKGGMGEVFLAEDTKQHGRRVALKILPPELTKDDSRVRRFKQESRAVLALNHPNIITIFEIGEADSTFYIASEFIEGETLRSLMWNEPMKIDEALGVAIQVAMALETAHAAGIVHRDIKPENIMLREDRFVRDRFVKILDFGLAKLTEPDEPVHDPEAITRAISQTNPGSVVGTAGYMSPEQAQGDPIDARSDIFSFGVVIYEMVAGCPPFSGPTESHIRVSIIDHEPAPLTQHSADIPRHLERIVSKALSKDKTKRYQTITDLKIDLERLREELHQSESGVRKPESHTDPASTQSTGPQWSRPTVMDTEPISDAPTASSRPNIVPGVTRDKKLLIPLAAIVLLAVAGAMYLFSGRRTINSVAVLPFVNDSNDPDAEYISDGVTESIIRSLSQLSDLKVMSRSAVFRFKGRDVDAQEVGRNLKVGAVLAGRVVRQGDRLIINTELIDVSDGSQLWSGEYNNSVSEILAVQDEISQKISESLRVRLTGEDEQKLRKRYTTNAEAYELYLKGRYFWNKRDAEGLRNGIKYFKAAEEKDPTYALAYSGLADSYALLSDIGAVKPADEMAKARAAAQRAVDIDPTLAEAYTSRAFVKLAHDWDWLGAEADFKKALQLNPKYPTAHQWYASYLMQMGKFGPAQAELEKAHQLDPLSPIINSNLGFYAYYQHNYDDALNHANKTLEMVPDFWVAHHYRGLAFTMKGMYDAAIKEFRGVLRTPGDGSLSEEAVQTNPEVTASLGFAYALSGKRRQAEQILHQLHRVAEKRYVSPRYLAIVNVGLDDKKAAIEQLQRAYENRHPGLVLIRVDPLFDRLRAEPAFQELINRFAPIP
ncbi:MAG TPA: protein kinase [Pyrinomonadaceae bacterium]|nr:protein kinase [Pyrinomonadaceae bacterium]